MIDWRTIWLVSLSLLIIGIGYWLYSASGTTFHECQRDLIADLFGKCNGFAAAYHASFVVMGVGIIATVVVLFRARQVRK